MFWNKRQQKRMTTQDMNSYTWSANFGSTAFTDTELKENTYFKCVKINSESVGKVPLILKQTTDNGERTATEHYLYDIMKNRPNPFMSNVDFWRSMEATRQHKGYSSALITRDIKGNATGLYPITITSIIIDNVGLAKSTMSNPILVQYTCGYDLKQYYCFYSDIIHLKSFTLDGMTSIPIKDNLKDTVETNQSAQDYQKDLFSNGLTNKALIQLVSDIKDEKGLTTIQDKFNRIFSNKGRIFTVPAGYQVTPLNLNLADSQFTELKKMGAVDICTSFGVPPHMIGIMDGVNNNSLEQSNLGYLVNTLLILFESIESECNYKLLTPQERAMGYHFEFDESVLLRTDAKTQAEILNSYIQNSVYTPNEARVKLGLLKAIDGDDLLASSGTLKIKDLYKTAVKNVQQNNNTE
jgi:HK97 family phage portal protein